MARRFRLHADELPGIPGEMTLSASESHHVSNVLRLREGDEVGVFDGRGSELVARVAGRRGAAVVLEALAPVEEPVESPLAVTLCQGCCRPDKLDHVIQKATELGVSRVILFRSRRDEAGRAARGKLDRWRRIAVEACKQSGRRAIPGIELADELPEPGVPEAWLLDPAPDLPALGEAVPSGGIEAAWIACGPPSGLTEEEGNRAASLGWSPVGLGPRVLRAETAALAALAVVLHRLGDLGC